jgi:predicted dehydrogenase
MSLYSRRAALKSLSLLGLTAPAGIQQIIHKDYRPSVAFNKGRTKKKLTAITMGAGSRGNTYGGYAVKYPDELNIIGVAEPIPIRKERYSKLHNIPRENQFTTWEHAFNRPKFADIVIITTPDDLHYGPAMAALEKGYQVLLEKPIAQTWEECSEILQKQKEKDAIVAVCHVLRYSPYFRKVKEVIDEGTLGKMVSVQHFEPIEHVHMAHSFVRGNWRVEADTNPIILAKSCHDLDILRWWIDKEPRFISSFGSLSWFKKENAPEGAPTRCTDGCPIESSCPYSAIKIYHEKRQRTYVFDLPDDKTKHGEAIMDYIKEGPYGRCVYHCDNDVLDHQIVSMEFADEITASFNMEAFTNYGGRRTRIMGSMGHLYGDETDLYVSDFRTGELTHWNVHDHVKIDSGHGGGDYGLVQDFLNAVDKNDVSLLSSNLDASMESHQMGFLAEKSRKQKKTMRVNDED